MDEAAAVIDKAAGELDDTTAPAGLESPNGRLVAHLGTLATDVQGIADQLRVPGFDDILQGAEGLDFPELGQGQQRARRAASAGDRCRAASRHTT